MSKSDRVWFPDFKKFKVICQRCGKTGEIDWTDPSDVSFLLFSVEDNEYVYEFWLCSKCADEIDWDAFDEEAERRGFIV